MYGTTLIPPSGWHPGKENCGPLARIGGPDASSSARPPAGSAADHGRDRILLSYFAHRCHAASQRTFGGWPRRQPQNRTRATLLLESDSTPANRAALVRSENRRMGIGNASPPREGRG